MKHWLTGRRGARIVAAMGALVLLGGAALPSAALVTGRPQAQHKVASLPPALLPPEITVPRGPHSVFGTITALRGATLTLRLRSGRFLTVDAAGAVQRGDFSAPLFVGKTVIIDGALRENALVAAHIWRVNNLAGSPADR